MLCVVRLRQADHSSRGVLPSAVCLGERARALAHYFILFYSLGESRLNLSDINSTVGTAVGW